MILQTTYFFYLMPKLVKLEYNIYFLKVIDLLVKILQFPLDGVPDEHAIILVFKEAYEVLYTYMIGKSRKNALYFAKYIEFFQTQFTQKVNM